jgi:hypothetical protein
MKKYFVTAVLAVCAIVLFFFLFAFGNWELNPGKWGDSRIGFSFVAAFIVFIAVVIRAIIETTPKDKN